MFTRNRILFTIVVCLLVVALLASTYFFLLSPINKPGSDSLFEIKSGSSIGNIAIQLKEERLIKSVTAFKLYVNLNNINNFQTGTYELHSGMSSKDIAFKFESGDVVYPEQVKITFPEGITLLEIAERLSKNMNYSTEAIINVWNSPEFLDNIISNFNFITDDIRAIGISYPLNGYLFPDTYTFPNKDFSPEKVAWIMLNRMEEVIGSYSSLIDLQDYSIHEILTLASIIEYEAIRDEDRPIISGIFHNRLRNNMRLESCATLEMALGVHKQIYTRNDIQVNSPYNTYHVSGLPIGPGNSPSNKSIEAVLKPANHNYYYFLSDIYGDNTTYFSSTLAEHNQLKNKYLR